MVELVDNLIDDIGLNTPNTEAVFRSLFPTDDPFTYRRRNVNDGYWETIKPRRWAKNAYEVTAQYSAKHDNGYKYRKNYGGPYLASVFTPENPKTIRNLVLDVDKPDVVPFLLTTPLLNHGIWCKSNSPGCWHIHVPIHEMDYREAGELVTNWLCENDLLGNKIETNVTGLQSTTLPGQSQINFPVDPRTGEQLTNSYLETKKFYVNWYYNKRVHLKDILHVHSVGKVSIKESKPLQLVVKEPKFRRNIKANIPGLNHAIGCTVAGKRYDYYSIQDCLDESDGFLLSNSFIPAVLRKFRGDIYLAKNEIMDKRQLLRTTNSKKENPALRLTHVNSMLKWFGARYDESKLKHDPKQELEDKTALIDFFIRDKRSIVHYSQKELKSHKSQIVSEFGEDIYRDAILTIPFVISSMFRSNGRLATKSNKLREEYTFFDSNCWLDFPTINSSRNKRDKIILILRQYKIFTSEHEGKDTHSYARHICSRWNVCSDILSQAKMRDKNDTKSRSQKNQTDSFSSTNIRTFTPEPEYDYSLSSDPYAQCWNNSNEKEALTETFAEKVHQMKQTLTPEM